MIKFGDIKYFTLLRLRDHLKFRDYDRLDLDNLDRLRHELDVKIEAIHLIDKQQREDADKHKADTIIPPKPVPPLSKVIREGCNNFCNKCGSTISTEGIFALFGEMLCHNKECPNSKSKYQ